MPKPKTPKADAIRAMREAAAAGSGVLTAGGKPRKPDTFGRAPWRVDLARSRRGKSAKRPITLAVVSRTPEDETT